MQKVVISDNLEPHFNPDGKLMLERRCMGVATASKR